MRVLLVYPELPVSFWSLQESCNLLGRKTLLPPLGLLTVGALLPREWELRLVDLNARKLTGADWDWADLVMLSGMIIQQQGIRQCLQAARERGKITVVGGPYASTLPHEVLEAGPDFLIRGEGEVAIPIFLSHLRAGKTGGVIEADRRPEMAESPVPRYDLLHLDDYLTMSLQTSRGCPFDCDFCDIVNLYGRVPRYKTPGQVIEELETLYRLGWRKVVFISDDNFIGNKDHARAILARVRPWMKDHGHPFGFWTQTSVNLGQDLEMIDLLTDANFGYVFLGVETPETDLLTRTRKYQNLRRPLGESLGAINANGLTLIASFIIGFDQEQPGTGQRICQFVEDNSIPLVMLNLLQPLPNTRLWDRLREEGRLLDASLSGDSCDLDLIYRPTRPREEVLSEYVRAIEYMYEPSRFLSRAYRYYRKMRPTRRALGIHQDDATRPRQSASRRRRGAKDWPAFFKLLWRQGVQPPYRWQFWKQLWGMRRHNPSRLTSYLICCGMGENLFALSKTLLARWAAVQKSGGR
jgi:radical SAM superfamily enzyme YgiQ (UPF0313 family)